MRRIVLGVVISAVTALAQQNYFPKGVLNSNERLDAFKSNWYGTQLKGFDEPSLSQQAKESSSECYRFIWLRSFHHPVVVRIEVQANGTAVLHFKVANGVGGYQPGKLIENTSRALTRKRATKFVRAVNASGFWEAPSADDRTGGLDGSQWVIEGIKGGKYHLVDRWSPTDGPMRKIGITALDLAGAKISRNDLY